MTRIAKDVSVFDRSPVGHRVVAERFDQPGDEMFSPDIMPDRHTLGNENKMQGVRSGHHIPEGRNDDNLLREPKDDGSTFHWDPKPPRANQTAIRGF